MNMFWEFVISIVLLWVLVVVLGPGLWSSRLSLTEDQKNLERQTKKEKQGDD